jgi:hypothetical protein
MKVGCEKYRERDVRQRAEDEMLRMQAEAELMRMGI